LNQLSLQQIVQFEELLKRRIKMEPIQYILGQWDFWDFTLSVRSPCLCPRPETEELVQLVCQDIKERLQQVSSTTGADGDDSTKRTIRVLDVGCGTGAIGIAIAKEFSSQIDNKVEVTCIDINEVAIQLTEENAQNILTSLPGNNNEKLLQAIHSSVQTYTNFINNNDNNGEKYQFDYDIVVSNPPYIPKKDMNALTNDVVMYEDYGALCGGNDGMDIIRDIIHRLPEWVQSGNVNQQRLTPATCWMEVDPTHPALLQSYLATDVSTQESSSQKSLEGGDNNFQNDVHVKYVQTVQDFCGRDRFVQFSIE
jgi:release factor glutamine methyltransferase